jgi:hypothetical protein
LGGWSEPVRAEINERLSSFLPDALPSGWSFVMVTAHRDPMAAFLKAIRSGPRPYSTLAVWTGLLPFVRRDTGEIICSQRTLADTAGVALGDVPRALTRLVEIGALLKEAKGRYRMHPAFVWKGTLARREEAQKTAPNLSLVQASP